MKQITITNYFGVLIKWRKFIIRNSFAVTVIAIIISLLIQKQYTATATVLPPNPEQEAMFGLMFGMSGGITSSMSSLAKLGGIVPGVTTPSDLYAAIMKSSRIKNKLIEKYGLKNEFKAKTISDAQKALSELTKIEITPEGIISVSVTYKNKQLATDIANSYVEELDRFNTETAMTSGKKYRIFIEQRLKETEKDLATAEEELRSFQEKHKTVALDVEIESAIQTIAELKSQVLLLEVQKGALSSSSQLTNPYLSNISRELRELKKQLSKIEQGSSKQNKNGFGVGFSVPFTELPEVMLEYARLLRNLKVQEAVYELLTQQYEQAKIMELKDTPTVQFLDEAGVPEKKSRPKRALIVAFALVLSLCANVLIVFTMEYFIDVKKNAGKHKFVIELGTLLSNDIRKLRTFLRQYLRIGKR